MIEEIKNPKKVAVEYKEVVETTYKTTDGKIFNNREQAEKRQEFLDSFKWTACDERIGDWFIAMRFWVDARSKDAITAELGKNLYARIDLNLMTLFREDILQILNLKTEGWHYMLRRECGDELQKKFLTTEGIVSRIGLEICEINDSIDELVNIRESIKERDKQIEKENGK